MNVVTSTDPAPTSQTVEPAIHLNLFFELPTVSVTTLRAGTSGIDSRFFAEFRDRFPKLFSGNSLDEIPFAVAAILDQPIRDAADLALLGLNLNHEFISSVKSWLKIQESETPLQFRHCIHYCWSLENKFKTDKQSGYKIDELSHVYFELPSNHRGGITRDLLQKLYSASTNILNRAIHGAADLTCTSTARGHLEKEFGALTVPEVNSYYHGLRIRLDDMKEVMAIGQKICNPFHDWAKRYFNETVKLRETDDAPIIFPAQMLELFFVRSLVLVAPAARAGNPRFKLGDLARNLLPYSSDGQSSISANALFKEILENIQALTILVNSKKDAATATPPAVTVENTEMQAGGLSDPGIIQPDPVSPEVEQVLGHQPSSKLIHLPEPSIINLREETILSLVSASAEEPPASTSTDTGNTMTNTQLNGGPDGSHNDAREALKTTPVSADHTAALLPTRKNFDFDLLKQAMDDSRIRAMEAGLQAWTGKKPGDFVARQKIAAELNSKLTEEKVVLECPCCSKPATLGTLNNRGTGMFVFDHSILKIPNCEPTDEFPEIKLLKSSAIKADK